MAKANHLYTTSGDQGVYSGGGNDDPVTPGNYPASLYLVGNIENLPWASAEGIAQNNKNDGVYTWNEVTFVDAGDGNAYFTFLTALDAVNGEWDGANQSDRYGAPDKDTPISTSQSASIVCYPVNVSAMGAQSWMIAPGTYSLTADLKNMKLSVSKGVSSVVDVIDNVGEVRYFNLQGVEVSQPESGLYIVVRGNKVTKELIVK